MPQTAPTKRLRKITVHTADSSGFLPNIYKIFSPSFNNNDHNMDDDDMMIDVAQLRS